MGFRNNKTGKYQPFSDSERRQYAQDKYERSRKQIMEKWITVWRLKEDRNWTDGAIKKYLPLPTSQNGYKVFLLADVLNAEQDEAFIKWMIQRIDKQHMKNIEEWGQEHADHVRRLSLSLLSPEDQKEAIADPKCSIQVMESNSSVKGACDSCGAGGMETMTVINVGSIALNLCDPCKEELQKKLEGKAK